VGKRGSVSPHKSRKERENKLVGIFGAWRYFSGEIPVTNVEIAISGVTRCNELIEGPAYSRTSTMHLFIRSSLLARPLCVQRRETSDLNCLTFSRASTFITVCSAGISLLIVSDCYFAISERFVSGKMYRPLNVAIMALKKNYVPRELIKETRPNYRDKIVQILDEVQIVCNDCNILNYELSIQFFNL